MKVDHRSNRLHLEVASITAMIYFHIILHPAVHIYDFHIFIISSSSFHGVISKPGGEGGEGVLRLIFAGYVPLASQLQPHLSHFWANM